MCNFRDPNLVAFYFYELTHFLDSMKNTLLLMNDFPVIGHLVMGTGLWDRQGTNIASRYKEMYGVELFLR